MKYLGHTITQSPMTTGVGPGKNTIKHLYTITGKYNKTAVEKPWLTSVKDVKDWIDYQIDLENIANNYDMDNIKDGW